MKRKEAEQRRRLLKRNRIRGLVSRKLSSSFQIILNERLSLQKELIERLSLECAGNYPGDINTIAMLLQLRCMVKRLHGQRKGWI